MRRTLLGVAYVGAAVVALAFLLLPIVAIFARMSPAELVEQLSNPVVKDAFVVSLKTSLIAQTLIVVFGTPAAFLLASRRFRGHALAVTLVELPLVLPPAVAGIGLLAAFGRLGLLGSSLDAFGISLPFTQSAVTIAVAYVASPLYIRQAIAAFEATDPNLAAASRTLGAGPARTFFRVVLPLARGGLIAGLALSFARGLGEFGATIMFAGSLQKVTQTLPLAIYAEFDQDFDATLAMSGVLVLFSIVLLAGLHMDSHGNARLDHVNVPLRSFELELSLDVGSTVALVGPSGAGKTTVLRAVAGLAPGGGADRRRRRRLVRRRARLHLPPERRRVGLVFQDYALFPHMTVRQNIEYARRHAADEYLERFRIAHLERARPSSPAASGSASRSHARSRATRRCCCSTSRSPRSTRTRRPRSAPSCTSCSPGSTSRSCSSRTTSRTRPRSPTRSA